MDPKYEDRAWQGAGTVTQAEYDEGLRAYMLKVYNYMMLALGITGAVAWGVAQLAQSSPAFAQTIYVSPLKWVIFLAPLALVFFLAARVHKMQPATAQIVFWSYAALVGLSLSSIFIVYTGMSIAKVFFITAGTFGAMSLYGYTTKRDLSKWGSFLFMGLIGIIIAIVVNIFLKSPALAFAISVIGVLIFVGLTAYDTQRIKQSYHDAMSEADYTRAAILGALMLYLDFLNMFVFLLHLFGSSE